MIRKTFAFAVLASLALSGAAAAAILYEAELTALNGSGVEGLAQFTLDADAGTVTVRIVATGVEPNQVHPQHIHGLISGSGDSTIPVPEIDFDTDSDGFVEVGEGVPAYGPVILPLMPFPEPSGGTVTFEMTYDLSDESLFAPDFTMDDLFPFDHRVYVMHGMTVPAYVENPEAGSATMYVASLPIAAGEIEAVGGTPAQPGVPTQPTVPTQVPEPATLALLGAGLVGLGLATRRRRR